MARRRVSDVPLPPEVPPSWEGDQATKSAPSATSSTKSTDGDHPSETGHSTSSSTETIPGVDSYVTPMADAKANQAPMFRQPTNEAQAATLRAPGRTGVRETKPVVPMGPEALEIASRIKEMFHAYSNRQERSQQSTLGPSEIGTPCDRRIAMSLLRLPAVNPGGDNWAAFVGTCVHAGLEDMLVWADAGSGRYAPEVKLTFPNRYCPKGTSDLVDRTLMLVADWKVMGGWSLNKLRTEGPSRTYRVQAHTYAYGAKLAGEEVSGVAIVGLPREGSSLNDLYVWYEKYRPDIAREALDRVERIGDELFEAPAGVAKGAYDFPIDNSDCRYCPYYMKGAATSEGGKCNGRN